MSSITTINSGDLISTSRTDINTNFSNLNTDKIETSYLDTDTSLTANSDTKIATQKAVKAYVDAGGNVNASTTTKGIVEEATSAEIIAGTGTGGTGARLFVNPTQVAETGADKIVKIKSTGLLDVSIIPTFIPFVPQDIPVVSGTTTATSFFCTSNSDGTVFFMMYGVSTTYTIYRVVKDSVTGNYYITHSTTLTITAPQADGMCVIGNYLYVSTVISASDALRRYDIADLGNVTTITFSGTTRKGQCFSDGTDLYIYNTTNQFDRFTISGTTATNAGTVTYTSSGVAKGVIANGTNVWISDGAGTGTINIRKYAIAGGSAVSTTTFTLTTSAYLNATGTFLYPSLFFGNTSILGIGWSYNIASATAVVGLLARLIGITLP